MGRHPRHAHGRCTSRVSKPAPRDRRHNVSAGGSLSARAPRLAPPYPSWGILIAEGLRVMRTFPHELLLPAVTLAVTLICFNFLGDGLRDALDPKLKMD